MQYTAPFCSCAIVEEFLYGGRDALIISDDLSEHAVDFRAMSLLLKKRPGRERSAKLSDALGGGSAHSRNAGGRQFRGDPTTSPPRPNCLPRAEGRS
jgi:hypothetical protein